MIVIRMENEAGKGPYNSGWLLVDMLRAAHAEDPERPSPYDDFCGFRCDFRMRFGFATYEQAATWFDGWIEILAECGFTLRERQTETIVYQSKRQLAFIP